jgi:sialate O-acetylesterase
MNRTAIIHKPGSSPVLPAQRRKAGTLLRHILLSIPLQIGLLTAGTAQVAPPHVRLANALQSNMVVQQNKPFKVWGTAPAGDIITVKADWLAGPVQVTAGKDNRWMGVIPVPPARKGNYDKHTITISDADTTAHLTNVLIGDVWFCSGQSNMQYGIKDKGDGSNTGIVNYEQEIAAANYPNLRLLGVALDFKATPAEGFTGWWVECSPKTVADFSGVAYSFGKELQQQLDIPIGIIVSCIGASTAQAYTSKAALAADALTKTQYLDPYENSALAKEPVTSDFTWEKVTRPYLLYNTFIHPFINLSISGFCWYQGESNRTERAGYTHLVQTMVKGWRHDFAQGDLPFYYVQVAPFFWDNQDETLSDYAFFREAQEKIGDLNNTSMIVTMDVGEAKNLHPRNKKPVGVRLVKTALNRHYGFLDIPYLGPHFSQLTLEGNTAIVGFDPETVKSGLRTNDGKAPTYFSVAGADKHFHPATAKISGNKVYVTSSKVAKPVAVRYAFTNTAVTNLMNGNGFPAVPFRTDNWPENFDPNNKDGFTVTTAPEWDQLFIRNSGWFGGDGIFSIPMNGVDSIGAANKTLLVFSDTMLGEIQNGTLQPGSQMINNSVAIMDCTLPEDTCIKFYWKKGDTAKAASVFVPTTPRAQKGEYYWLGDGFVNKAVGNTTYVFAYRIQNTTEGMGFKETGNALLIIPPGSKPPFTNHRQKDTPFYFSSDNISGTGSFGAGILVNDQSSGALHPDGYVYVYGVRGIGKDVLVARVKPAQFENFSSWRFWDGKTWTADMQKAAAIANKASNEMSVTPLPDGRYVMVFQVDGMGGSVCMRIGSSPYGPFGPIIKLYDCPETKEGFYTYNAKAHPNLSQPGELLISYNVNAMDFFNVIKTSPNLYRPRFIKVKFN